MQRGFTFLFLAAFAAMTGCAAPATETASTIDQAATSDRHATTADGERKAGAETAEGEHVVPDTRGATGADPTVPTFADVEPILADACTGCHRPTAFATIEKIKDQRAEMLLRISTGGMPQNEPQWFKSADGKLVLDFLRNSPELD